MFEGFDKVVSILYLQWTLNETRFETAGGTSFEAIHKYAPICLRSNRVKRSTDPLYDSTADKIFRMDWKKEKEFEMCMYITNK